METCVLKFHVVLFKSILFIFDIICTLKFKSNWLVNLFSLTSLDILGYDFSPVPSFFLFAKGSHWTLPSMVYIDSSTFCELNIYIYMEDKLSMFGDDFPVIYPEGKFPDNDFVHSWKWFPTTIFLPLLYVKIIKSCCPSQQAISRRANGVLFPISMKMKQTQK